ncbi:MAG: hypothetical protein ACI4J4_10355 [Ruminiclostridium sp.]
MNSKALPCKIISLILSIILFASFADCPVFAAAANKFTINIGTDISGADLSGVKFDIYTSSLTLSSSDYDKYTNKYAFSVYSDSKGNVSFTRPSGMFIVKADLQTLPKKTAITEDMWTVTGSKTKSISADIDGIRYIDIETDGIDSENVKVGIFSAARKELFCKYTVDISEPETTETVNEENGRKTYTTSRTITVRANGKKKTKTLKSEKTETANPVVSLKNDDYEYTHYLCEKGGFFRIYYNSKDFSEETVTNIYSTFVEAESFFEDNNFNPPMKQSSSDYYNIYLITEGGASATTKHVKNGTSYMILQPPKDYTREKNLYYTSVIAHELFHAIMYTYTRAYGINPPKWFREAFANWAGIEFINSSTNTLRKYVNIFQSNPGLPLTSTYDSRVYGSTMFALTISEYFGGIETIREIMLQYEKISPSDKNPEMTAISKGLAAADKSYSRTAALIRFALNNMYPSHYYSMSGSEKWDNACRSGTVTDACTLRNVEVQPLSARYYDISTKSSSKSVYISVFDNSGKYSNLALCSAVKKKDGSFTDLTDRVKAFSTYRIKNFTAVNTEVASIGIIDTSLSRGQDVTIKAEYR